VTARGEIESMINKINETKIAKLVQYFTVTNRVGSPWKIQCKYDVVWI
jgi:hypothetical protein